jgi:hypothetical protein
MCSIEEAWAGQSFEGRTVTSQADLRRKYMAVPDELLERNNEFSVGRNDPTPRDSSRGLNSRLSREPRIPNIQRATADANMQFNSVMSNQSTYGGLEPRPGYMSIYDNADKQMPQPVNTNGTERFNNNDINNAFMVSNTVNKFMNNALLDEDNDEDRIMLEKKFNQQNRNSNTSTNTNNNITDITNNFQKSLMEILNRLDRIENQIKHNSQRNMYDIALYILIGLLIAFIVYLAISRK